MYVYKITQATCAQIGSLPLQNASMLRSVVFGKQQHRHTMWQEFYSSILQCRYKKENILVGVSVYIHGRGVCVIFLIQRPRKAGKKIKHLN